MKRIIYTRSDGGVSVVIPVISLNDPKEFTEDDALARATSRLPIDAINPQVVEANQIPADRSFRNAWNHDGVSISVDLPKAREITKERLRMERAPKLVALDVEFMWAIEQSDAAAQNTIAAQKQTLRDITQFADTAQSLEELKALKI